MRDAIDMPGVVWFNDKRILKRRKPEEPVKNTEHVCHSGIQREKTQ